MINSQTWLTCIFSLQYPYIIQQTVNTNLAGRRYHLNQIPNSHNYIIPWIFVTARGGNQQSNLEVKGLSYKEDLIKKPNLLDHINHLHLLQIFLSFAFLELLLGLLKWLPLNIFSLISISTFPKSTLLKNVQVQFLNYSKKELFQSPLQNFLKITWHESF